MTSARQAGGGDPATVTHSTPQRAQRHTRLGRREPGWRMIYPRGGGQCATSSWCSGGQRRPDQRESTPGPPTRLRMVNLTVRICGQVSIGRVALCTRRDDFRIVCSVWGGTYTASVPVMTFHWSLGSGSHGCDAGPGRLGDDRARRVFTHVVANPDRSHPSASRWGTAVSVFLVAATVPRHHWGR